MNQSLFHLKKNQDSNNSQSYDSKTTVELKLDPSSKQFAGFFFVIVSLIACQGVSFFRASAQSSSTMVVGAPSVDANGVKYYPVTSVYQTSQQQIIRVLEPTNPVPDKPRRTLYVLPVVTRMDTTPQLSDGLEELRLLDVPNRFNMTLIAPSFNYEPWYGDNILDPTLRMESFIIDDLVPFGDTFAQGNSVPQRYLIGFSKSGNGALFLILRHPGVFNAAAAWDSPAQLSDISTIGVSDPGALPMNFGTQANFDLYNIPSLVAANAQPFQQQNRLWISGDEAAWTADMDQLQTQMTAASIDHTWVSGTVRAGAVDGSMERSRTWMRTRR